MFYTLPSMLERDIGMGGVSVCPFVTHAGINSKLMTVRSRWLWMSQRLIEYSHSYTLVICRLKPSTWTYKCAYTCM